MSTMNILPLNTMDSSYIGVEQGFVQPFSMDMLDELSWPNSFMVSVPYMF
jgi:hypothetical protein